MKTILLINYDDSPDEIVDKVNAILEDRWLVFVDDEEEHEGHVIYRLQPLILPDLQRAFEAGPDE